MSQEAIELGREIETLELQEYDVIQKAWFQIVTDIAECERATGPLEGEAIMNKPKGKSGANELTGGQRWVLRIRLREMIGTLHIIERAEKRQQKRSRWIARCIDKIKEKNTIDK